MVQNMKKARIMEYNYSDEGAFSISTNGPPVLRITQMCSLSLMSLRPKRKALSREYYSGPHGEQIQFGKNVLPGTSS